MKSHEFNDNDEGWLDDAKVGNFSTMPNPFTWDRSVKFAHIIDGYGVAGGVDQCQKITNSLPTASLTRTPRGKRADSVGGSVWRASTSSAFRLPAR